MFPLNIVFCLCFFANPLRIDSQKLSFLPQPRTWAMLTCQDLASMMSIWCLAIMLNRQINIRETFKDVYTCWACVYIYIFNKHMFIVYSYLYMCCVICGFLIYTCVCVCVRFGPCCAQCSDGSDAN